MSEMQRLINAIRGKCAYTVSLGMNEKPRSVAIKLDKGQMNVYESTLDGMLAVTIDHMTAVPVEHVLKMLGIEEQK